MEQEFQKNGFILKKNLLSKDECNNMLKYLDNYKDFSPKDLEPYSDIPYIYNNILKDDSPFKKIITNKFIKKFSDEILREPSKFYFLKVNNKSKWIGQDICYHQEIAISKHMGLKKEDSIQIFMALEPHTLENGSLFIFEKSHQYGEIEHEDFFDTSFNHKLRVPCNVLNELNNKYKFKKCILEPGDCLIFNQYLVHGSPSNKSPNSRKAIVGWITKESFQFDEEKNKKFWIERQNKTLKSLEKKMDETKEKINNFTSGMKLIK